MPIDTETIIALLISYPHIVAAGVVIVLLSTRYFFPGAFHAVPWRVVRRILYPYLQRRINKEWGEFPSGDMPEEQHLATVDKSPVEVQTTLEDAGYVEEPLAAVRADWTERQEYASLAKHYGPKLFPGAPTWLKERQVHLRLYPRDNGTKTAIVGHDEYNSWRPDLVKEHLTDETLNIERAQKKVDKIADTFEEEFVTADDTS